MTLALQKECVELKQMGDEDTFQETQRKYDHKAKELDETTKLITQIETELLEAKVLQKRRIMERLRISSCKGSGGGSTYRSPKATGTSMFYLDESESSIDLVNLSSLNADSANQSFIDKENAEMVQEHLDHCLSSLQAVASQLQDDTSLL